MHAHAWLPPRVDGDLNIKIADFGLARNVYTNDYYRQHSAGKIPIRWMAPEALHDRISNEKTDVVRTQTSCTHTHIRTHACTHTHT